MAMLVYQRVNRMFIVFVCVSVGDPYRYGQQWPLWHIEIRGSAGKQVRNSVENMKSDRKWICRYCIYPLVNVYIAIENHHVEWENSLFLWPFSIAILT